MPAAPEALQRYLESLSTAYDVLAQAAMTATERGYKVSKALSSDVIAAQRETMPLAKQIAADPEQYASGSYVAMTQAAIAAQSRTLAFAQLACKEALDVSGEAHELAEKLTQANRETGEAALELLRSRGGLAPMAEMFSRGFEATMQATEDTVRRVRKSASA